MRDNERGGALTEVTFFILLSVFTPRHGYAIMQFVEEQTAGRLTLGAGTLYGALNTLAERGWIAPHGEGGGRRRAYCITPTGRAAAERELQRLRTLAETAERIMAGQEETEHG